jgi:hypothetical protein
MTTEILPMRRVLIASCWPYSGKKYEVWERNKCVLRTDDAEDAKQTLRELE